jgi:hypothetical protein
VSFNDRCQEAADNLRLRPHLLADLPHTRASLIAILDGYADGDGLHMPDAFREYGCELGEVLWVPEGWIARGPLAEAVLEGLIDM